MLFCEVRLSHESSRTPQASRQETRRMIVPQVAAAIMAAWLQCSKEPA